VGKDVDIICQDCKEAFCFEGGEQEFYDAKGLPWPRRCPSCRLARKQKNKEIVQTRYGAICTICGKDTTVPFVPEQGRPIYCKDCYRHYKKKER
jgi:CxxC-x17-CxxC domain-containing protein